MRAIGKSASTVYALPPAGLHARDGGRHDDALTWGDELEYQLLVFDEKRKVVRLSTRAAEVLERLQADEEAALRSGGYVFDGVGHVLWIRRSYGSGARTFLHIAGICTLSAFTHLAFSHFPVLTYTVLQFQTTHSTTPVDASWKPEYARFMIEGWCHTHEAWRKVDFLTLLNHCHAEQGTPGQPYAATIKALLDVEPNMQRR